MRYTGFRFLTAAVLGLAAITATATPAKADPTLWQQCHAAAWHDCYDQTGGNFPDMADCLTAYYQGCDGLPGDDNPGDGF